MIRIKPSKLTNRFGIVNERREKQKSEVRSQKDKAETTFF
jgi:hypothetical protein